MRSHEGPTAWKGRLLLGAVVILFGCAPSESSGPFPSADNKAPAFRYSLKLESVIDLDRAFATANPVDTLGMALNAPIVPRDWNELKGVRKYVELLKKSNGPTSVHLLLSRGESNEEEHKAFGELFMVLMDREGRAFSTALIDQFECSEHVKRTLSLGWYERALFCHSAEHTRRNGEDHAVVTFVYATSRGWLDVDTVRISRDVIATSTVLEGESALVPMCAFN